MGLFKRHQKVTADIQFVDHNKQARKSTSWTSEDIVEGTASFRIPPSTPYTRTSVALKGVVTTRTNESSPGSLQPNWRVERVKFLSVGRESPADPRSGYDDGAVRIPFRFDLSECSRYSGLESGLAPSLDAKDGSKAAYDVTYTIAASAYSARGLIVSAAEKLTILPVGQPAPPSYGLLDEAREYFTATTSNSRSKIQLSKRADHVVDIAGREPSPLVLRPESDGGYPSTSVDLLLKVSSDGSRPLPDLPRQAHIRTQLVSKTQITPDAARALDAGSRHAQFNESRSHVSKGTTQECSLAVPMWETYHPDADTPAFAIARLSLLYRLSKTERPVPTFSTPVLSRTYALDIKIAFPEDGGQNLKLSLPAQVMYEVGGGAKVGADDGDALERKLSKLELDV